jgi:cell wall-associated NlpC family hydrolase
VARNSTAALVGRLSGWLAQAQTQLLQLRAQAEKAEQLYALAVFKLEQAKQQAVAAQAAVQGAEKKLKAAQVSLQSFVRNSYLSPTISGNAGSLLTAKDPNALLEQGDYLQFVSSRHLDATSQLDEATIAKSNADARAKSLVLLQQKLTIEADAAQKAARAAYQAEQLQAAGLRRQQQAYQIQLAAARLKLADLTGQRRAFQAYEKQQREIAAAKARADALRRAQALAAQEAAMRNNGGGGGGGGFTPVPTGGSCGSGSAGARAVCWAMQWLGTPYAWAGGGYGGPSTGTCDPGNGAPNDCNVSGFDCSGLTMYAWAHEGLFMDHFAATQFSQAGSFHPSPGNYQPGDLLFWGLPGQYDIHHVAMYIGGGNVIQAPNSGSYVQITPWDQVSGDYYGATRPMS